MFIYFVIIQLVYQNILCIIHTSLYLRKSPFLELWSEGREDLQLTKQNRLVFWIGQPLVGWLRMQAKIDNRILQARVLLELRHVSMLGKGTSTLNITLPDILFLT